MAPPVLRVLLVGADARLGAIISGALGESEDAGRFELATAPTVAEAADQLQRGEAAIVLLPLRPPEGLVPLVTLRAGSRDTAVVVVCGAEDEPLAMKALQLGATDYLVVERLFGTVLARSLLHAAEVQRTRRLLASREAEWPASLRPDGVRVAPLRAALPGGFEELVRDYGSLLDRAVAQALYRVDRSLEPEVQRLAARAGELRAGPRDIVDVHAEAMRGREPEHGPQRMKLYMAEGRLRLLELMGHLVTYYRDLALRGAGRGQH